MMKISDDDFNQNFDELLKLNKSCDGDDPTSGGGGWRKRSIKKGIIRHMVKRSTNKSLNGQAFKKHSIKKKQTFNHNKSRKH